MLIVINATARDFETWEDVYSYFDTIGKTNIRDFRLSNNNQISEIPERAFSGLSSLQELYLNDNVISEISERVFSDLSSLRRLQLNDNQIFKIHPNAFSGLTSLEELHLHNNRISEITPYTFSGLTSLERLLLYNNRISKIHPYAFSDLSSLQELWLNHNQISEIYPGTFSDLSSLEELNLSENQISVLHSGAFSGLTMATLQGLRLENNPLVGLGPPDTAKAEQKTETKYDSLVNPKIRSVNKIKKLRSYLPDGFFETLVIAYNNGDDVHRAVIAKKLSAEEINEMIILIDNEMELKGFKENMYQVAIAVVSEKSYVSVSFR
jgi:Leucine-rich repeat (LRR) protein